MTDPQRCPECGAEDSISLPSASDPTPMCAACGAELTLDGKVKT